MLFLEALAQNYHNIPEGNSAAGLHTLDSVTS
jgi:hypothetical protein